MHIFMQTFNVNPLWVNENLIKYYNVLVIFVNLCVVQIDKLCLPICLEGGSVWKIFSLEII